ncbi:MAG: vanadium-dependent haloperoxidase [Pseudomonadota bacterium]|nr:vanadium-dependent haloperoxidase [Pseudomonadota bacterium]
MGNKLKAAAIGAALFTTLHAAGAKASDNVVLQWNNAVLQAIRDTHPGPPMAARMLQILSNCEYDSWAAYDARALGTRLGASLRRPASDRTDLNKRQAVSYAAYRAALDLFPTQAAKFTSLMTSLGYDPTNATTDTTTPAGVGNVACAALLSFRHDDGSNQLGNLGPSGVPYSDYTGFTPVNTPTMINDPNQWQPLIVSGATQKYIGPYWGNVTPFALKSIYQYDVNPPAKYGTPEYVEQSLEAIAYSATLTDQQKVIAEYWANGPRTELPPGHWNLFSQFVSHRDNHTLDQDVTMFFAVNNAMLDASVWSWGLKRVYLSVRPITSIHYLYAGTTVTAWGGPGAGTQTISGAAWQPYQASNFVTPPFPEFPSGHSTFSRAAAEVLREYTGSDVFGESVVFAPGSSGTERGATPAASVTLSWALFSDAANEAGISRRYGGIHFQNADLEGRRIGEKIGKAAYRKSMQLINGERDEDHAD